MKIKQILTAIALTLCILSAAIVFTLNFRPLYYMDIHHFNLPENTGYSEEEIRENYDTLIDYNSVFYREELEFPTLTMSEAVSYTDLDVYKRQSLLSSFPYWHRQQNCPGQPWCE